MNKVNVNLLSFWRPEQKAALTRWRPDATERPFRRLGHGMPTSSTEKTITRIRIMNSEVAKSLPMESRPRQGDCSVHSRAHTRPSQVGGAAATKKVRHGRAE